MDSIMLSLLRLSQYHDIEITRGRYNIGQHRLHPSLQGLYNLEKDKPKLTESIDPKKIVCQIKDAMKDAKNKVPIQDFKKCYK